MTKNKRLIFEVRNLEKEYDANNVLKIKKLEIHPGTIYGIVGNVGSGKTTLLSILAGLEKESSGVVLYEDKPYETNWYGKIKTHKDIFFCKELIESTPSVSVSNFISKRFGKKKNVIKNRYFKEGSFKNLFLRNMHNLSAGELNWLGMILACESDPRVLIIDDYGIYFNENMERDFKNKITNMNRTLGTTVILSSPSEKNIKHFASVLIFLDHGHIWKIRSGQSRNSNSSQSSDRKRTRKFYTKRKRSNSKK
ncbi:MAG: hypothetical protein CMG60_08760 [Candidatus Marinimicrobia bacterium]|nr:hypothetical protein [Candidatus Neomarinimicrobiota bacterium]